MIGYQKSKIELTPLKFRGLAPEDVVLSLLSLVILFFSFLHFFIDISSESNFLYLWYIMPIVGIFFLTFIFFGFSKTQTNKKFFSKFLFFYIGIFAFLYIVVFFLFFMGGNFKNLFLIEIMLAILMIMPYIFIILPTKLLYLLYHKILQYRFFEVTKSDFFTSNIDYELAINTKNNKELEKYDVIFLFDAKTQSQEDLESFNTLKRSFAYLIYFWYAYEYEKVYLRFILPLWSVVWGILFFVAALSTLDAIEFQEATTNNLIKMSLAVVFLTLLFIFMLYQVNNTLHPKEYLSRIIKEFKRLHITFKDGLEPAQKIFIFLDRNFLIYIYDKKYDRKVILNNSKSFEKFIRRAELDKEGRDNIASILVTLFIVVYIEIFAQVLSTTHTDERVDSIQKVLQEQNKTLRNIYKALIRDKNSSKKSKEEEENGSRDIKR